MGMFAGGSIDYNEFWKAVMPDTHKAVFGKLPTTNQQPQPRQIRNAGKWNQLRPNRNVNLLRVHRNTTTPQSRLRLW